MSDSRAFSPEDFETAEHHVLGEEPADHIVLEGDADSGTAAGAQAVKERIELRDRLRGTLTELTIFEGGVLRLIQSRRGKRTKSHRIDLRYLDPVPRMLPYYPKRILKVALGFAVVTGIAALLASFDVALSASLPAAVAAGTVSVLSILTFIYLSHEKVQFETMHGRAKAVSLVAGFGCLRRLASALPRLIGAIEDAEENIGEDTTIYLRAEMREHYRLRGDGVLSELDCNESTGRILTHFDDEL